MFSVGKFCVKLFSGKVGSDSFGNEYYEARGRSARRYVIYGGEEEPSTVPPSWRAWLHWLSDEIPSNGSDAGYEPNLTGTPYRYDPRKSFIKKKIKKDKETLIWKP